VLNLLRKYLDLDELSNLFVCLLLNGTSALFRPLVQRIVEVENIRYVIDDL